MNPQDHPFAAPVDRVPLANSPLIRVVTQVRYPQVLAVGSESFIAPFQELIREDYPILGKELQALIRVSDSEISPSDGGIVWRFSDPEEEYQVSLATGFVALQVRSYKNREDFMERWGKILEAISQTIKPIRVDRYGIRYIDRIDEKALLDDLETYVRPELLGPVGSDLGQAEIARSVTDSVFVVSDEYKLKAKWGLLPANEAPDPELLLSDSPSWILDLDGFIEGRPEFSTPELLEVAQDLSDIIYRFFRWATTDEFIRHFGGDQ